MDISVFRVLVLRYASVLVKWSIQNCGRTHFCKSGLHDVKKAYASETAFSSSFSARICGFSAQLPGRFEKLQTYLVKATHEHRAVTSASKRKEIAQANVVAPYLSSPTSSSHATVETNVFQVVLNLFRERKVA